MTQKFKENLDAEKAEMRRIKEQSQCNHETEISQMEHTIRERDIEIQKIRHEAGIVLNQKEQLLSQLHTK